MKISQKAGPANVPRTRTSKGESGFATLIVFVLLTIMSVFIVANALTLRHLKRELRLIEKLQLKNYPAGAKPPPELRPPDKRPAHG